MYLFRWFPEYMKFSEIRERFKYTVYKEVKEELWNLTEEEILQSYKGQGDWFYGKVILIKGKKFIYVYFANENKLEQAVTEGLELGCFHKRKRILIILFQVGAARYTEQDVREMVAKAIEDQEKEKELIKESYAKFKNKAKELEIERLAKFKYTEQDLEDRVAKMFNERVSKLKYTEEDMEKSVAKAIDHLIKKREWTQDFVDYGKYKYTEKDVKDMMELYKYTEKDLQLTVDKKVEESIKEKEEWDKEIVSKFKYTEKDMEEIVNKAIEDQVKEKEMFKENVIRTANEIASMMGVKLDNIDFGVSNVNKDRQTEVLFQEIQKANAKRKNRSGTLTSGDILGKSLDVKDHVINEKMKDTNGSLRIGRHSEEVSVSQEEIETYNKINQVCSSRLPPKIKKEVMAVDEKIGQKRGNKDELSRGMVSSDGTEDDSESDISEPKVVVKEQVNRGGKKIKKVGKMGKMGNLRKKVRKDGK
ncbi:uncharacterized protein OCT59_007974 [Rhizophagus irregularis]|uniref:uncharacterized protein n=1 Tax=Rhizophagus irregularis TaxID=588596 RepID=UPI00331AECF0|nr:hypothetical protein OCT59_007974 [Rhizophagus irregularis]